MTVDINIIKYFIGVCMVPQIVKKDKNINNTES